MAAVAAELGASEATIMEAWDRGQKRLANRCPERRSRPPLRLLSKPPA
jgi:hypothetical protein